MTRYRYDDDDIMDFDLIDYRAESQSDETLEDFPVVDDNKSAVMARQMRGYGLLPGDEPMVNDLFEDPYRMSS